ncbi:PAN-3 domain-containing protein [Caenorhabditis elegans]|uniref:PAN-3 domain-containing protein n=1 Tax=Caenorhabditis elegans TaxID=6239 RepID=Q7YTL3_CAEEL|nr:PAN-3 domain-containing protein [Caenorhabditis elegans]CAE17892.3 PAN-3 domain-containing protein [Caenorhabditis elegans]|eukprot:NP_001343595.2 Uncharacterized protein CELE_M199.7 [Caenorhabditis elegans]
MSTIFTATIIFILIIINSTESFYQKMVIIWGIQEDIDFCEAMNSMEWPKCAQKCYETEDCVTAVLDTSGTCFTCKFKAAWTVKKTSREGKTKVAFKLKADEGSCPDMEDSPLIGDASTTTTDAKIQNYTITFTGTHWEFEKYSLNRCEADAFYRRPNADRCLTFIEKASMSYDKAINICAGNGYDNGLSGLASKEELERVVSKLQTCRVEENVEAVYVRIDGQRTEECQETPTAGNCMSIDGFTRHDQSVQNFDVYQFMTDSSAGATEGKQCMVVVGEMVKTTER